MTDSRQSTPFLMPGSNVTSTPTTVRFTRPRGVARTALLGALEECNCIHLHHFDGSDECIAVFPSQNDAERGYALFNPTSTTGSSGQVLSAYPENSLGYLPGHAAMQERRREEARIAGFSIAFSSVSIRVEPRGDPAAVEYGNYYDMLDELLPALGSLYENGVGDELAAVTQRIEDQRAAGGANQQEMASCLISLARAVQSSCPQAILDNQELERWTEAMEWFARGELSMHVDRFANTVVEFSRLLDDSMGTLGDMDLENMVE